MKNVKVFDTTGKRIFELTNNGEISVSDGYSVIVNGGSVGKDKNDNNENCGFFTKSNSFSWFIPLFMLLFSAGDANSKDIDLLADAFGELKESKNKTEENIGANNVDG